MSFSIPSGRARRTRSEPPVARSLQGLSDWTAAMATINLVLALSTTSALLSYRAPPPVLLAADAAAISADTPIRTTRPEAQLQALQRARMLLDALPDSGNSQASYTTVLRAFSEAAMPEECTALLRRMRRETRSRPSLECYGFVVSALQAAGRPREAARWLRRVVQPEVSHSLVNRAVDRILESRESDQ